MNRDEFYTSLKKYKDGPAIMHAEEWEEQYLDTAAASLAKASLATYVGETEDAEKFQHDYLSCIENLPDDEEIVHSVSEKIEALANEWFDEARSQFEGIIEHGTPWKDHKYIKIVNGRYIYEDPQAKANTDKAQADGQKKTGPIKAYQQKVANLAGAKAQDDGEKKTVDTKRGMADNAIKKYQEDGMKRTVVEEQKKAAVDKQKTAAAEVSKGDNSEKKTNDSMAGYDAWKKLQAQKQNEKNAAAEVRKGDDSVRRAEEEGKAQDAAKKFDTTSEENRHKVADVSKLDTKQKQALSYIREEDYKNLEATLDTVSSRIGKKAYLKIMEKDAYGPSYTKMFYRDDNGHEVDTGYFVDNRNATYGEINDTLKKSRFNSWVLSQQEEQFVGKPVKHSDPVNFETEEEFHKAVIAYKTSH